MKARFKSPVFFILFSLTSLAFLNAQTPFTDVTIDAGLVDPDDSNAALSHIATEIITA